MLKYKEYKKQKIKEYLLSVLMETKGDCTKAAVLADVNRTYFYGLCQAHEVETPKKRVSLRDRGNDTSISALLRIWR
jgi:hypothetical protein